MRTTLTAAALLVMLLAPVAAQAQGASPTDRTRFGVQVSYADDAEFGVGAHVDLPLGGLIPNQPMFAQVAGDIFFPGNDVTYFEVNGNVVYRFRIQSSPISPYAGAGLNFAIANVGGGCTGDCSSSDLGVNVLGGIQFPNAGRLLPFVQIRYELGGGEQFVLTGGIHF